MNYNHERKRDESCFTKKAFNSRIRNGFGWFLKFIIYSRIGYTYLDYQVWQFRLYKWNPFSWILFLLLALIYGFINGFTKMNSFYEECFVPSLSKELVKSNNYFMIGK